MVHDIRAACRASNQCMCVPRTLPLSTSLLMADYSPLASFSCCSSSATRFCNWSRSALTDSNSAADGPPKEFLI